MTAVLRWGLAGLACAVVARVGMMLLTRHPEPTRSGTVAILVVFTLGGLAVGVVDAARRAGRTPWTRLVALVGVGIFLGAGAVLGPGKVVGEAELWLGNPARLARKLSDKEVESLLYSAQHYVRLKDHYLGG